ncbi:hypothetical protein [Cryptosporangium aurantiacum]|nr:hypothetical protein [Cryptosporangium aurantiacum]
MADTMRTARAAQEATRAVMAAAEARRAISRAITQELPVIRLPADEDVAPVGARFYRPRRRDTEDARPAAAPTGFVVPEPVASPAPTGARFYRERKSSRRRG